LPEQTRAYNQQEKTIMKTPKKQPKKTAPAPKLEAAPDWVKETPDECDYDLAMYDSDGDSRENFNMTRAEFLMLKHVLAANRGYDVSESEYATTEGCEGVARRLTRAIQTPGTLEDRGAA
jgi:hypothetical protein